MTIEITSKQLEELQENFNLYFYESGAYYDYSIDYESEEASYIEYQLGTDDWVLKDTIEE